MRYQIFLRQRYRALLGYIGAILAVIGFLLVLKELVEMGETEAKLT